MNSLTHGQLVQLLQVGAGSSECVHCANTCDCAMLVRTLPKARLNLLWTVPMMLVFTASKSLPGLNL